MNPTVSLSISSACSCYSVPAMAKCVRCGKETDLHEFGVPICTDCIDEREGKKTPKKKAEPDESDNKKDHKKSGPR